MCWEERMKENVIDLRLISNARKTKTNARRSFFWVKNCVDLVIRPGEGRLEMVCVGWSSLCSTRVTCLLKLVVLLLLHQFFVLAIFLFSCVVMFSSSSLELCHSVCTIRI